MGAAELDLIEERDGWRHARVENRIHSSLGRIPSKRFAINATWVTCALTAVDLIA